MIDLNASEAIATRLSAVSVEFEGTRFPEIADMLRVGANEIERLITDVKRLRGVEPEAVIEGCEFCGDFPVVLSSRCHATAPLRVEMPNATELVFYCYIPACGREVARFTIAA